MDEDILIGEWIRRRRKALDLSQKKLAALARLAHLAQISGIQVDNQSGGESLRVSMTYYTVLKAEKPGLAQQHLSDGYKLLHAAAAGIVGEQARQQFLQNLPDHRAIKEAWADR